MRNKIIHIVLIITILSVNLFAGVSLQEKNSLYGAYRGNIEMGDLDGDGDQDMILCSGGEGNTKYTKIYLNDGSGHLSEKSSHSVVKVGEATIELGDLNGDNHLDILIAGDDKTDLVTKIYINDGNANFTEKTNLTLEGVETPSALIGDFNEDGHNDFIYSGVNSSNTMVAKIYINDGNGDFTENTNHSIVPMSAVSISYGDLNGDNHKDILMAGLYKQGTYTWKKETKIYLNDGNASFTLDTVNLLDGDIYSSYSRGFTKIVDLDGDSDNDIIYTGNDKNRIYLNSGDGNFTIHSRNLFPLNASSIDVNDIDNDGDMDILLNGYNSFDGNSSRVTKLYLNDGNLTFIEDTSNVMDGYDQGRVHFVDLNGDNVLDVVTGGAGNPSGIKTTTYITTVNDTPTITEGSSISLITSEDESNTTTLNVTDSDVGDTLTWTIKTNASNGVATVSTTPTGNSQVITYTPDGNYSGVDSFIVKVSDSKEIDTIDVNVTINAVNDLPYLDKNSTTLKVDETTIITNLNLNYIDVESLASSLIYTLTAIPSYGDLNLSGTKLNVNDTFKQSDINNSLLTYSNNGNSSVVDSFKFKISDGGNELNGEFSINIRQKVIWTLENNSTKEDEVLQIDLSKYATDPEGNTSMLYSAESNDTNLATVILTNSILSIIPVEDKSGVVGITTYAFDGDTNSSKSIQITITAVEDNPTSSETNTIDGGFSQLPIDINANIVSYITNHNGYDYIAFSNSNSGNKLSVYKRVNGNSSWSDIVGTNISDNAISSIYYFDFDGSGNLYIGYIDSVSGNKLIMYDGSNFINLRSLKKRALGTNWSDMSPPAPFNTGKYTTTITDRANNIYTAFQDTTNSLKRGMLMRYDGSSWEVMTHDKIRTDDNTTTNYFSLEEVIDISMVVDSTNRLYIAYIDKVLPIADAIVIQTYSNSDNNISYLSGVYNGFISTLKPKAKRVLLDVNSSDTLYIAYITSENNLTVMDYNGSWNYVGKQSIVDSVVSTELGFMIDKNSIPYIALVESSATDKIKIKKYVDSNWSDVDTISASGVVNNLAIIKDSVGNPYISFNDLGDNNDSKIYFLERYKTLSVKENNLSVGAVNITADTSLTFSLSGTDSSLFDVNNSGYITIKTKLDYENPKDSDKNNYYEFNVSATDTNSKEARLFVKVKVEDINNTSISNINLSNTTIAENSAVATKVGDFNITAVDIDGNIEYKLCDNSTTNGVFSISNSSLVTATSLDYETMSSYKVCIKVTDLNTTAYYEENITISVTDVTESSSTTSSGSSGSISSFSTVIKAKDDSKVDENTLQIEINNELEKDVIDTEATKTVQTKDISLEDGTISKTIVEIPKDNKKTTNLKATVEVKSTTQTTHTTLEAEEGVKVSISNDRSITSKVKTDTIEAEVKVNQNAEAEAKIVVQKRVEVTIKSPKGSEIKQENSGRVTSKVALSADTTKGVKPVEVQMSAEIDGNLVASAKVTDESGEVQIFNLSLPNSVISGGMELVASEIGSNTYKAIKSTYKTSENFTLNRDSRRIIVEGDSIQIVGTTAWQKFEEKQYFNGRRTIILLLGGAKILRDGVEEVMLQNEEYEFIPTDTTNTSSIDTLTTIYSNSYLNIQYGWNLITTPVDKELDINSIFKYATESYKYSGEWIKEPTTIRANEGLWIKYSEHISEKIDGASYEPTYNSLNSGWNLLGAGRDIKFYELSSFSEVWAYDSKVKSWIKNPITIKRGYGFWVK